MPTSSIRDLLQIGPVRVDLAARDSVVGRLLRDHASDHRVTHGADPALRLLYGGDASADAFSVAKQELLLSYHLQGTVPTVTSKLRLTPRALLRFGRRLRKVDSWWLDRLQVVVRYGFEHPLMTLLHDRYGFFPLHSSAVGRDDELLLILGPNNSGKTTLATALTQEGQWALVNDNFTPTDGRQGLMFPGRPRFKDGQPARHLARREVTPQPLNLAGLIFLGDAGKTRRCSRDEAMERLTAYIATEREDHRDSQLRTRLVEAGSPSLGEEEVVERLSHYPFVMHDRSTSLQDLEKLL